MTSSFTRCAMESVFLVTTSHFSGIVTIMWVYSSCLLCYGVAALYRWYNPQSGFFRVFRGKALRLFRKAASVYAAVICTVYSFSPSLFYSWINSSSNPIYFKISRFEIYLVLRDFSFFDAYDFIWTP